MFFCSGPPRTYAVFGAHERMEDVALAMHPLETVFARVSSSYVTLWSASLDLPGTGRRLLACCRRSGQWIEQIKNKKALDGPLKESVMLHQLWTVWVSGNRLAVVEKDSQSVEFYAFDGLNKLLLRAGTSTYDVMDKNLTFFDDAIVSSDADVNLLSSTEPKEKETDGSEGTKATSTRLQLAAKFVEDYPLNQGTFESDYEDVACSMTAVPGSNFLFVGMASGMICVVEVGDAINRQNSQGSWFSNGDSSTKIWKIDVRTHLAESGDTKVPSCYELTCASTDLSSTITSLYLVASFEGGNCFILLLSPFQKSIDQLLSLINTERDINMSIGGKSSNGRCTTISLDASGSRLALGWMDGSVSLFQLSSNCDNVKTMNTETSGEAKVHMTLALKPIQELSLVSWGYASKDIGYVTALAWFHDGRSIAVGYEQRGFSLYSTDGCRLMSSLPQHKQERSEKIDNHHLKEMCAFGVLALLWTKESNSLIVVPRGEQSTQLVQLPDDQILRTLEEEPDVNLIEVAHLYEQVQAKVQKEEDGLCLSLSGAPGRCGAWVRSDRSFTKRAHDGGMGPAEACGRIQGGDLLVGIDGNVEVVNLPFEQIISQIKGLPDNKEVVLTFMRLKWDEVFSIAVEALSSSEFMDAHGIHLLDDEDLCIREYALRMQALHGDCDSGDRPPLMEFECRAKFDGWEAIQGTTSRIAKHKYVKLLYALFPVWNPDHFLNVLTEYWNAVRAQKRYAANEGRLKLLQAHRELVKMRQPATISFAQFDFAKNVPLSGGYSSQLALVESKSVRLVAAPSLDDPCALTSCAKWSVPVEFVKCCPLRLVTLTTNGNHLAVAGQRGFCLLNIVTGKWRMFGNVNDEQDMFIFSFLWVRDDAIVVNFTRFSENHELMHLQAYPRNHLDEESILEQLVFTRQIKKVSRSRESAVLGGRSLENDADDCFFIMECDNAQENLFCISRNELWCFKLKQNGTIKQNSLRIEIQLKRRVNLPSRMIRSQSVGTSRRNFVLDFAVLPRFLHIPDQKLRKQQLRKFQKEREYENDDEDWLSSFLNMMVGGEVPDQYTPEEVLPRFAFLDSVGDVIIWDPENRSQRLLCSNVSTMVRLFVSPEVCASWPAPCRLIYWMYGPKGMEMWLPQLDGVYMTHTKAFEEDSCRLETFLACHDPLRAKTYVIEFGTAPATAELYEQVIGEYGIVLDGFLSSGTGVGIGTGRMPLKDGYPNLRGCVTSVDDPFARDGMLRFDYDVKVLGSEQTFGLLVGVSQDVYVPSGVLIPCYDVFARVQPIFHTLLCFLVQNDQISWARLVLNGIRNHFGLSTPTQELFLHSMLEACFANRCSEEKLHRAIHLLLPSNEEQHQEGDIAEYCEIVAHVARKSEPSRLKILFPAAGDPISLLNSCRQRSELRTAANFLLILDECSTASTSSLPLRMQSAAELLKECIDQEEWVLAQHVVRVARDWEQPSLDETSCPSSSHNVNITRIDERLASLVWDYLVHGEYERVVSCVEDLQAKLPHKSPDERQLDEDSAAIMDRLNQIFVQNNKQRQLRTLLHAVTEAHYDDGLQSTALCLSESKVGCCD
ncbi:unnamed protein product [Peronospora belbahrii]|uniref:ACB domain-containing protein n=1 Tax=Peronospora belbahrii TaxID=622444 RepID=A0AAU9KGX5_9STRA|nr:unnamed protein product [Peronospora belbahrii]